MKCIQEELEQILNLAKGAIENSEIFANEKYQGVNWSAVNVADVCFCRSIHGDCHYEVLIDEASPDAWEFACAVHRYIQEYSCVSYPLEVRAEW